MNKVMRKLLPMQAIALVFAMASAVAQKAPDDVYALGYYSGANITGNPDTTVRVINDGSAGEADLCAAFYVLDSSEELQSCCSCPVTADGVISQSVNRNLLGNVLTVKVNNNGVIKVLSTATAIGGPSECNASAQYTGAPTPGIRGWMTHIQVGPTPIDDAKLTARAVAAEAQITEDDLKDSNYTTFETGDLQLECQYLIRLGGGHGVCSCTAEDTAW
jgi:hypothetical protein